MMALPILHTFHICSSEQGLASKVYGRIDVTMCQMQSIIRNSRSLMLKKPRENVLWWDLVLPVLVTKRFMRHSVVLKIMLMMLFVSCNPVIPENIYVGLN